VPVRIEGHVTSGILARRESPHFIHIILVAYNRRIHYSILHEQKMEWIAFHNGDRNESSALGTWFRDFVRGEKRVTIRGDSVSAQNGMLQIQVPGWMEMEEPLKIQVTSGSVGRLDAFLRNWNGTSAEVSADALRRCPFD
jgi:hypothetical protein